MLAARERGSLLVLIFRRETAGSKNQQGKQENGKLKPTRVRHGIGAHQVFAADNPPSASVQFNFNRTLLKVSWTAPKICSFSKFYLEVLTTFRHSANVKAYIVSASKLCNTLYLDALSLPSSPLHNSL